MFETNLLIVSMLWSTVGTGCLIYGKKQGVVPAMIAGLALIGICFFLQSALLLSGVGCLCLTGMVWAIKQGY